MILYVLFCFAACGKTETKYNIIDNTVSGIVTEKLVENVVIEPQVVKDGFECIVQVQTDDRRGSGILWEKQENIWIFVTAAHVVDGTEQAEVYFVPEDEIYAAQVQCVQGLDLAFLKVETTYITQEIMENYEEVDIISSKEEMQIVAKGYSALAKMQNYDGVIQNTWIYTEDFENYMLCCKCEAQAGMSGGGIFTKEGELTAIICGQNEHGLLAGIPVAVLESEYQMFIKN